AAEVADGTVAHADIAGHEAADTVTERDHHGDGRRVRRIARRRTDHDGGSAVAEGAAELGGRRVVVAGGVLGHAGGDVDGDGALTAGYDVEGVGRAAAAEVADATVAHAHVGGREAADALAEGHGHRDGRRIGWIGGGGANV